MFAKFFESELAYLRERGAEFASGPYQAAAHLLDRGGDPDVERLLEGFAFLTARIRERLEDAVPELVENLVELFLPHMLRPLPATAIVQFSTNIHALRGPQKIARGRPLEAPTRHGVPCRFRTAYDLELLPIEVASADVDRTLPSAPALVLRLRLTEASRALLAQPRELRFFIAGEPALTYALRLLLLSGRCRSLRSRLLPATTPGAPLSPAAPSSSTPTTPGLELGPEAIVPVGFADDEALVPWPVLSHPGLRLVQEYMFAPEKFSFFGVRGPFFAEGRGDLLELRFSFDGTEVLPARVSADNFRLHCTPAINLFDVTADPVRLDPLVHEHRLQAAGLRPDHAEVYAVQSVRSSRAGRADERIYTPFFSYAHAHTPGALYYSARRSRSPVDGNIDLYLAVHAGQTSPDTPARSLGPEQHGEVLHVDLLCTNRMLAADLGAGAINREPRAGALQLRSITPITPPVPAPLGSELYWRLLSHLSLGQASLADAGVLRNMLALYDFQAGTPRSAAARIAAIRKVDTRAVTRLVGGAPVRGTEVSLELDEAGFPGPGEAHLLLSVLDALFADSVGINSFNQVVGRLHPSDARFRWPARSGNLAVI